MANIIIPKKSLWYDRKPTVGSQINWGLAPQGLVGCWLMNEGGGNIVNNLAKGVSYNSKYFTTLVPYSNSFNWTPRGIYLDGVSNNFLKINANFNFFNNIFDTQVDYITFVIGFSVTSLSSLSDLMGNVGNTGHGPELRLNTDGSVHALGGATYWQNDGGIKTAAGAVTTNMNYQLIASYIPYPFGNSKGFISLNGIKLVENTNNSEAAGGTAESNTKCFGANVDNSSTVSNRMTGYIEYVYIIIRKTRLSPSEIQSLSVAPYQFIQPTTRRVIIIISAGQSATANANLISLSLQSFSPTVTTGISVSPSLIQTRFQIFSPTISTGTAATVNATLIQIKLTTFSTTITTGISVSPSLIQTKIQIFSSTVTTGISITTNLISLKLNTFNVTITTGIQVSSSLITLRMATFAPMVTVSTSLGTVDVLLLNSRIEKTMNFKSRIDKYFVNKSEIDKTLLVESPLY